MERSTEVPSGPPPRAPLRPVGRQKPKPTLRPVLAPSFQDANSRDVHIEAATPPNGHQPIPQSYEEAYQYASWVPVRRDKGPIGAQMSASDASSLKRQSGLTQMVTIRQLEKMMESDQTREIKELDHKIIARVANSTYYTYCSRCGELTFLIILISVVIIIVFLGVFFTFYH